MSVQSYLTYPQCKIAKVFLLLVCFKTFEDEQAAFKPRYLALL